jgi:hypothetical protein
MEVAEFAPAMPVTADQKRRTPSGVVGSCTGKPGPMQGARRSDTAASDRRLPKRETKTP